MNVCFITFIAELVLGFNGRLLVLGNIPIRQILFGLVTLVLGIKMLLVIKDSIIMKKSGMNMGRIKDRYFIDTYFSRFDKILALFLIYNMIWILIIPIFTGTSIKLSIKETLCGNLLFLYFPIVILIKSNLINWDKYKLIIKTSIFALALIHIAFYIGEILVGDCSFVLNIFKGIQKFTGGHTIRPIVMMPDSYIRIIYPASILLIMIFYFTMNNKQTIKHTIFTFIGVFALFTTVTKSLFVGVVCGLVVYCSMLVYKKIKNEEQLQADKIFKFMGIILISCIVLNYTIFDNYIFMRLKNPFVIATEESQQKAQNIIENSIETDEKMNEIKENAGTERANRTRIIQIQQLLNVWKERPLLGWGYGSSAGEYLRSNIDTPNAYEMVGVALLMKIGVLGILGWVGFF